MGDAFFHAPRRLLQQAYRDQGFTDHWTYHFELTPPLGLDGWLGTFHALEMVWTFGIPKLIASGIDILSLGLSRLLPDGLISKIAFSDKDAKMSTTITNYWYV